MKKIKNYLFSENGAYGAVFIGVLIILFSVLLFLLKGSWKFEYSDLIDEAKIGQYGDFIGGFVGSIFSLVGVILFYVALKDQQKDFANNQTTLKLQTVAFKQQIEEFKAQRYELEETRKIYEQQNKTMKNQQFDSNFYSLLNVFIKQRDILFRSGEKGFFETIITELQSLNKEDLDDDFARNFRKLCSGYNKIYLANRAKLALYFVTLYRLYRIIEDCEHLSQEEKNYYHKILRAIITKDELLVLYYNYHSSFGKKPLPIVLKYNYFKHLEPLSKIEFNQCFELSIGQQVSINKMIEDISGLIKRNVSTAQDLENVQPVREEIELEQNVILGIYIDSEVEFKLITDLIKETIIELNHTSFVKLIECVLIDNLYHSRFRTFNHDFLARSVTTSDTQKIYNLNFPL